MLVPARARRSAIGFMAAEENRQRRAWPQLSLHPRHDGAAQRAGEPVVIGLAGEAVRDGESEHAFRPSNRRHEAETEIAAVADQERTRRRFGECDLDMPKPLLRKARSGREGFRTLPFGFERLTLHAHRLRRRRDARMAQRLTHGPFRRGMLAQALGAALRLFARPAGIDAPARGALRQSTTGVTVRQRRDFRVGIHAIMVEHRAIVGRSERRCARLNLTGLRVEIEHEARKRPGDVGRRDRTIRRRGDKHAPDRAAPPADDRSTAVA